MVKKEIWYQPVALVFQQLRYFVLAHKDQISNEQSLNLDLGQGYSKSKKMAFHFSAGRSCEKPISVFQKKNFSSSSSRCHSHLFGGDSSETPENLQRLAPPYHWKKTRGQRVRFWPFELCRSNGPTADAINLLQLYRYTVRFEQRTCKQIHSYN